MEQEKSVFNIINEIDKNILYQQAEMAKFLTQTCGYYDAVRRIKELLKQRERILKMNKKYGLSNFNYCDDKKNKDVE